MLQRSILEPAVPSIAIPAVLLSVPAIIFQVRAKNFPASLLLIGLALLDIRHATNTLAFYGERYDAWDGYIFCPVDIRLRQALYIALLGATACIFRQLASAVRTDRIGYMRSKRQNIAHWTFELTLCFLLPATQAALVQVVTSVYATMPVVGCWFRLPRTWFTIIVLGILPLLITCIATTFCVLALYRLVCHRIEVANVILTSAASKRRYARLFFIASLGLVMGFVFCAVLVSFAIRFRNEMAFTMPTRFTHPPPEFNVPAKLTFLDDDVALIQILIDILLSYPAFILLGLDRQLYDLAKKWWLLWRRRRTETVGIPGSLEDHGMVQVNTTRLVATQRAHRTSSDIDLELCLGANFAERGNTRR